MKVLHSRPAIANPTASIEVGESTWDPSEKSIRLRCQNANGSFSRGSPEVPAWTVDEILQDALKYGLITRKRVAEILAASL